MIGALVLLLQVFGVAACLMFGVLYAAVAFRRITIPHQSSSNAGWLAVTLLTLAAWQVIGYLTGVLA